MGEEDQLLIRMRANPWFAGLTPGVQHQLLTEGRRQRLQAGEFLFRQDQAPGCFHGLVQGALKVSTLRKDGKEAIVTVFEAGNWFGETSLLDGLSRTHDISAVNSVEVLCIEPQLFDRLMNDNGFARAIATLQAVHLRLVYTMLEDSMLRTTRARIARRLEHLARGDATRSPNQRYVIDITQDALAMMLGITRQTLALELKTMAAEGALVLKYRQLQIASLERLRAIE
ncbi:Crp/Fnr family transcriptional regulator [Pseudomonas sp. NA-150]|uniref:Crp/Fnr family transcriptional regulator n=1 Tax=Pseudomonas sp. NA-150 TaxID=3367525 RepID=UPI0037CCBF8D